MMRRSYEHGTCRRLSDTVSLSTRNVLPHRKNRKLDESWLWWSWKWDKQELKLDWPEEYFRDISDDKMWEVLEAVLPEIQPLKNTKQNKKHLLKKSRHETMRSWTKGWQEGWKGRDNSRMHFTRWVLNWRIVVWRGEVKGGVKMTQRVLTWETA